MANALAQGTYVGNATLTDGIGTAYIITVNLTVNGGNSTGFTVTPNPLTFNAALNSSLQSAVVSFTSDTGGA